MRKVRSRVLLFLTCRLLQLLLRHRLRRPAPLLPRPLVQHRRLLRRLLLLHGLLS
jgi:hypothetical protein